MQGIPSTSQKCKLVNSFVTRTRFFFTNSLGTHHRRSTKMFLEIRKLHSQCPKLVSHIWRIYGMSIYFGRVSKEGDWCCETSTYKESKDQKDLSTNGEGYIRQCNFSFTRPGCCFSFEWVLIFWVFSLEWVLTFWVR